MRLFKLVLPVVASALFLACTPSPEKVCGHVVDLMEKESKDKDKDSKKSSDDDKKKFIDDCAKDLQKSKDKDGDKYKECAKCVMDANDSKGLNDCDKQCKDKDDKDK